MKALQALIDLALKEDIGSGDVTTETIFQEGASQKGTGILIAKEELVVAGLEVVAQVYQTLVPEVQVTTTVQDGDRVAAGHEIATITTDIQALLKGERTALNFLQHLSGVATLTRHYVDLVKNIPVQILDTRKTTPGYRELEKYAVRMGGGHNHRQGLYDQFLIKDNHIDAAGSLAQVFKSIQANNPKRLKVEVEVRSLEEVKEVLNHFVDIIMLDNMDLASIEAAVQLIGGKAKVEASGGINEKNIQSYAETGVDAISVGALTHSAPAVDISLKIN
jgi:nicotinate-nucleotide pyrophosphorylase (carboxylating)